jgi:hypothetical protein
LGGGEGKGGEEREGKVKIRWRRKQGIMLPNILIPRGEGMKGRVRGGRGRFRVNEGRMGSIRLWQDVKKCRQNHPAFRSQSGGEREGVQGVGGGEWGLKADVPSTLMWVTLCLES